MIKHHCPLTVACIRLSHPGRYWKIYIAGPAV